MLSKRALHPKILISAVVALGSIGQAWANCEDQIPSAIKAGIVDAAVKFVADQPKNSNSGKDALVIANLLKKASPRRFGTSPEVNDLTIDQNSFGVVRFIIQPSGVHGFARMQCECHEIRTPQYNVISASSAFDEVKVSCSVLQDTTAYHDRLVVYTEGTDLTIADTGKEKGWPWPAALQEMRDTPAMAVFNGVGLEIISLLDPWKASSQ